MRKRLLILLALLLAAGFVAEGCRKLQTRLGIGYDVTAPEEGTPEKVLQDALRAAADPDAEKGWQAFMRLLHSDERSPNSLSNWEGMTFSRMRRQVKHYLKDEAKFAFEIKDVRDLDDGGIKYFLFTSKSDMPTPCTLRPDKVANNQWRISGCSL